MKVVVLAASKGGTGKTTLCCSLAVRAAEEGAVAMLDLDPLQSLARWAELRGKRPGPALATLRGGLAATVERVRREKYEWLFIDTQPSPLGSVEPAVHVADFVLIVVQASIHDIEAVAPIVEMAKRERTAFAFALNRIEEKSTLTAGAIDYLQADGRVLKEHVTNRESHKIAAISGMSAGEGKDKQASAEIDALWKSVKKIVAASVKAKR